MGPSEKLYGDHSWRIRVAGDEFDPFKLIKKILGRPEEPKAAVPPSKPVSEQQEAPPVKVAEPELPKSPKLRLLHGLETMTDQQRLQRMVELGQIAAGDTEEAAEAKPLIAELASGNFYERRLAMLAWMGAADGEKVFEARNEPSAILRKLAAEMAVHVCTEEQIHRIADEKRGVELRRFLLSLVKHKKTAITTSWLVSREAERRAEMGQLIAFGSAEFVAERLLSVCETMDGDDFSRLARRHPAIVAEFFLEWSKKLTKEDPRFSWLLNSVEKRLSDVLPDSLLEIVRTASGVTSIKSGWIRNLIRRRPAQVVELLVQSDLLDLIVPTRTLHKLPDSLLLKVMELKDFGAQAGYWLSLLKPSTRDAVFEQNGLSWRNKEGVVDAASVKLLSSTLRVQEARRNLALPSIVGSRAKLPYAALLPSEEIMEHFKPFIGDPDVTIRSTSFAILIGSANYNREDFTSLLKILEPKRNEPDPVRAAFFSGFCELSSAIWTPEHLAILDTIIKSALNAPDLSYQTVYSMCGLCIKLLPVHLEWACGTLAQIFSERGTAATYTSLAGVERCTQEQAMRLEKHLLDSLKSWSAKERDSRILTVARAFQRRLDVCDHICDHLADIARSAASDRDAGEAVRLLHQWRRERFTALVPELLEKDKTWAMVEPVTSYIHRHRQDLLTPFLGQTAYKGRFSTGKTRVVPAYLDGFKRWTSTQQSIYARELEELALSEKSDVSEALFASVRLAALPEPPMDLLRRLSSKDYPKTVVRDYVLQRLARLDARQGLPLLLEAFQDDRARIAVYAFRNLVLSMSPTEAMANLKKIDSKQITVQKEVVRLIGDVGGHDALTHLLSMAATIENRDVKAAVVRAMWNFTADDHMEVWDYFDEAAHSEDRVVASAAVRIPYNRLNAPSRTRLFKILAKALNHPVEDLRLEALRRIWELPLADEERILLKPLQAKLLSKVPGERHLAADAILLRYAPEDEQVTEQAILSVLYHRRELMDFIGRLQRIQSLQPTRMTGVIRACLRAMWTDPLSTELQLRIALGGLPQTDLAKFLLSLEKSARLHFGAVQVAVSACTSNGTRMTPEEMDKLERILFNKSSEGLRRIGLALLQCMGEGSGGWTPERIYRLNSYRKDSSLMIQCAAEFILPSVELDS